MQFFRGCSGLLFFHKMERINQTIHYYLSYPIYGSNQRHKTNNVKNDTLFKVWDPQRYLPSPYMYMGLPPSPPPPTPKTWRVTWQANMDRGDECQVIHEFSVVKCFFCYSDISEFKYMKWFISFFWWQVTGSFMSFILKRFSLVSWLIKAEIFITEDMHVWPKKII